MRALTKLHVYALVPRRWPLDFERAASHPSLARRSQAIRAAAGVLTPSLGAPTVLKSSVSGAFIVLDGTRAYWFEGVPPETPANLTALAAGAASYRAVSYGELTELRVVTTGATRGLKATDRLGHSWTTPLDGADVAAAQAALDVVDVRLGDGGPRAASSAVPVLIAALILVALLAAEQVGVVLIPLVITAFRPSTAALVALGVMAASRALVRMAEGGVTLLGPSQRIGLIAMLLLGVVAAWLALKRMPHKRGGRAPTLVSLGVAAILLLGGLARAADLGLVDPVAQHPVMTTLAIVLLGMAAALASVPRPAPRWGGGALAAAALGLGALSLGDDLFSTTRTIVWSAARPEVMGQARIDETVHQLRLSPGGTHFAVRGEPPGGADESDTSWPFTIGSFAGARRALQATDVAFVNEEDVIVLAAFAEGLEILLERVDADDTPLWRDTLPPIVAPVLSIDRASRTWTISGINTDADSVVICTGGIGAGPFTVRRWPTGSLGLGVPIAFGDGLVMMPVLRTAQPSLPPFLLPGITPFRSDLWSLGGDGARRVGTLPGFASCGQPGGDDIALCVVNGRERATIWSVGARGELAAVGPLPSGLGQVGFESGGLLAAPYERGVVWLDAREQRGTQLTLPEGAGDVVDARPAQGMVAALWVGSGASTVTLYRVE